MDPEKAKEIKARAIVHERNALLAATDWLSNSDVVMPDEMRIYRQALRDVTEQAGFPDNVVWPTTPRS